MGVEVSQDDVFIMEVKKTVNIWDEISGTARENVNVMNVDGILLMVAVKERCSEMEVLGENESRGDSDEDDGLMNESELLRINYKSLLRTSQ